MNKTIIDISNQIKVVEKEIKELYKKVKTEMDSDNKTTQMKLENKIESVAKRYPIKNHSINKSDEHIIKLYLTLLLSIDQATGSTIEDSTKLYVSRLIEGLDIDLNINDLIKWSMKLDYQLIDEFTISLLKTNLNINFAIDSMIILNLSCTKNKEKIRYISNLYELIGIKENQVEEIVELSNIICSKDKESYKRFCTRELNINLEEFLFYIVEFVDGVLCNNSELVYVINNASEIIDKDIITSKKVILENLNICDIVEIPTISKSNSVKLKNCIFKNIEKEIKFYENNKISIEKCEFEGFRNRALYCRENKNIEINNTNFESCRYDCKDEGSYGYQSAAEGGAIYNYSTNILKIENCKFKDCNTYHYEKGNADGAIAYLSSVEKIYLNSCEVKDCMNYSWKYGSHWDKVGGLFKLNNVDENEVNNCTRINSCKNGIDNLWGTQSW
ncbi:MAG: hypothetical protein ACRCXT_23480 [Paraclostridium sp.]